MRLVFAIIGMPGRITNSAFLQAAFSAAPEDAPDQAHLSLFKTQACVGGFFAEVVHEHEQPKRTRLGRRGIGGGPVEMGAAGVFKQFGMQMSLFQYSGHVLGRRQAVVLGHRSPGQGIAGNGAGSGHHFLEGKTAARSCDEAAFLYLESFIPC